MDWITDVPWICHTLNFECANLYQLIQIYIYIPTRNFDVNFALDGAGHTEKFQPPPKYLISKYMFYTFLSMKQNINITLIYILINFSFPKINFQSTFMWFVNFSITFRTLLLRKLCELQGPGFSSQNSMANNLYFHTKEFSSIFLRIV